MSRRKKTKNFSRKRKSFSFTINFLLMILFFSLMVLISYVAYVFFLKSEKILYLKPYNFPQKTFITHEKKTTSPHVYKDLVERKPHGIEKNDQITSSEMSTETCVDHSFLDKEIVALKPSKKILPQNHEQKDDSLDHEEDEEDNDLDEEESRDYEDQEGDAKLNVKTPEEDSEKNLPNSQEVSKKFPGHRPKTPLERFLETPKGKKAIQDHAARNSSQGSKDLSPKKTLSIATKDPQKPSNEVLFQATSKEIPSLSPSTSGASSKVSKAPTEEKNLMKEQKQEEVSKNPQHSWEVSLGD